MARVNWDDGIYKLGAWGELIVALGSQYEARGRLLHAYELIQAFWVDHRGIPLRWWPEKLDVLIEHKFAERRPGPDGEVVYLYGAEERCKFLESKAENGRKGGQSKSPAKTRHLKQNRSDAEAPTEAKPKQDRSEGELSEASYSSSVFSSDSFSDSDFGSASGTDSRSTPASQGNSNSFTSPSAETADGLGSEPLAQGSAAGDQASLFPEDARRGRAQGPGKSVTKGKRAASPEIQRLRSATWERYSAAIEAKYHHRPIRNKVVNSQVARMVERLGPAAPDVAEFFVTRVTDPGYVRKAHMFGLCLADCEALELQMRRGRPVTAAEMRAKTADSDLAEAMGRIDREGV